MADCERCRELEAENARTWKWAEALQEARNKALETADAYRDIYAARQDELEEAREVARELAAWAEYPMVPSGFAAEVEGMRNQFAWLKETSDDA